MRALIWAPARLCHAGKCEASQVLSACDPSRTLWVASRSNEAYLSVFASCRCLQRPQPLWWMPHTSPWLIAGSLLTTSMTRLGDRDPASRVELLSVQLRPAERPLCYHCLLASKPKRKTGCSSLRSPQISYFGHCSGYHRLGWSRFGVAARSPLGRCGGGRRRTHFGLDRFMDC